MSERLRADALDITEIFLEQINQYPVLSREQMKITFERYRSGKSLAELKEELLAAIGAENKEKFRNAFFDSRTVEDFLLLCNLRLVVLIARRYKAMGVDAPLLDLIQFGSLGLKRAIERFDPKNGASFSTYAFFWIKNSIRRGMRCDWSAIHLPHYLHEILLSLKNAPADGPVAPGNKNVRPSHLERAAEVLKSGVISNLSLDGAVFWKGEKDESLPLLGQIADGEVDVESTAISVVYRDHLRDEVLTLIEQSPGLSQEDKKILSLYFGLGDNEGITQKEIGKTIGKSREYVRLRFLKIIRACKNDPKWRSLAGKFELA